ncbi:MAG: ferritin-like domain-containing protein, partial [Cyanobacteria bacterium REEB65]|nr:ferritin-like domain-containing protein [Cyanobacteria bacterium REEB65]
MQTTNIGRRELIQLGLTAGTLMAVTGLVLPESAMAKGKGGLIYSLNGAVDKENRAVWAYKTAAGTGNLSAGVAKVATTFMGQHAEHAAALSKVVIQLGGTPARAKDSYDLASYHPDLSSQDGI